MRHLIFDTDGGSDDISALALLLGHADYGTKFRVELITCVCGNVSASQAGDNMFRSMKFLLGDETLIPVRVGCEEPLIGDFESRRQYMWDGHGMDGMGNKSADFPLPSKDSMDRASDNKEHASVAMVRVAQQFKDDGGVEIITIGPLSNVAMACKLDPKVFPSAVKQLHIMGGTMDARGNSSACAEFNFIFDPEAALVTLESLKHVDTVLASWELTESHPFPWEWVDSVLSVMNEGQVGHVARQVSLLQESTERGSEGGFNGLVLCDMMTIGLLIDPTLAKATKLAAGSISCEGITRGMLVLDYEGRHLNRKKNIQVVRELDVDKWCKLVGEAFQKQLL